MTHLIFDINDIQRLRGELRLTNEYAEALEKRVEYLEDCLAYERDPSWYNQQRGHSLKCVRVIFPRSFHPCDCRFMGKDNDA